MPRTAILSTYLGRLERHTEQNNRRETLLDQGSEEAFKLVDTPAALAGHGCKRHMSICIISDEDGIHEHGFGDVSALVLPCPGNGVLIPGMQDGAVRR